MSISEILNLSAHNYRKIRRQSWADGYVLYVGDGRFYDGHIDGQLYGMYNMLVSDVEANDWVAV